MVSAAPSPWPPTSRREPSECLYSLDHSTDDSQRRTNSHTCTKPVDEGSGSMRDGYRIIDIDTHVIPAMEVLRDYADASLRDRWDELTPYLRTNPPRPELGDYEHPNLSLSVAPYSFDR